MRLVGGVEGVERRGVIRTFGCLARRIGHSMAMPTVAVDPRALVEEGHALGFHARDGTNQASSLVSAHETRQHHARDAQALVGQQRLDVLRHREQGEAAPEARTRPQAPEQAKVAGNDARTAHCLEASAQPDETIQLRLGIARVEGEPDWQSVDSGPLHAASQILERREVGRALPARGAVMVPIAFDPPCVLVATVQLVGTGRRKNANLVCRVDWNGVPHDITCSNNWYERSLTSVSS